MPIWSLIFFICLNISDWSFIFYLSVLLSFVPIWPTYMVSDGWQNIHTIIHYILRNVRGCQGLWCGGGLLQYLVCFKILCQSFFLFSKGKCKYITNLNIQYRREDELMRWVMYLIVTVRSLVWGIFSIGAFMLALSSLTSPSWIVGKPDGVVIDNRTVTYRDSLGLYNRCGFRRWVEN